MEANYCYIIILTSLDFMDEPAPEACCLLPVSDAKLSVLSGFAESKACNQNDWNKTYKSYIHKYICLLSFTTHSPSFATITNHWHSSFPTFNTITTIHHHYSPPPFTTTHHHSSPQFTTIFHHHPPPFIITNHHHHSSPPFITTIHHHHSSPSFTTMMASHCNNEYNNFSRFLCEIC